MSSQQQRPPLCAHAQPGACKNKRSRPEKRISIYYSFFYCDLGEICAVVKRGEMGGKKRRESQETHIFFEKETKDEIEFAFLSQDAYRPRCINIYLLYGFLFIFYFYRRPSLSATARNRREKEKKMRWTCVNRGRKKSASGN